MDMTTWAEKEIEIACARERAASGVRTDWDYGVACYESALKAFKCLMEDGHSGASIHITKNFLNRLIDGKPLTPIEDTPDIWGECLWQNMDRGSTEYQCTRMSSLFKDVFPDGTVKYHDVNRTRVTYVNNQNVCWHNGTASRIIDEMFPITMPYAPANKPYTVYAEEFLVDPDKGDFDTVGYLYVITPDGTKIDLNRYFKEDDNGEFVEIDYGSYCIRKEICGA